MNRKRLLKRVASGSLQNVGFQDMANLVEGFGFVPRRTKGSHHIYSHADIPELVNLQNAGGKAKPYQIRQFLRLVERYNMQLKEGK